MPRSDDANGSPKLSPAQERLLVEALRAHPAKLATANRRVAAALESAGLLGRDGTLTPAGMDMAARMSAQKVIDAVNARKNATATRLHHATGQETAPAPGASTRHSSKPRDWPFPESAHAW